MTCDNFVRSCTDLYKAIQRCTQFYKVVLSCTNLYGCCTRECAWVEAATTIKSCSTTFNSCSRGRPCMVRGAESVQLVKLVYNFEY